MRVLPYGERALLLEVDDAASVLSVDRALRRAALSGVTDVVPAARTLLLRVGPGVDLGALRRQIESPRFESQQLESVPEASAGDVVEIPARYDGPDLAAVAARLGLTADDVVAAHTGQDWTVAFCGFAPGFAYLTGADERLASIPRLESPRTRIPAGAVALAGGFSAVYPTASPGGWHLIGQTDVRVFDVHRDPPAVLTPGAVVRFVAR